MNRVEEKLRMLPDRSGVYLFRDTRGRVLYVGKAKRLPSRVRSYFRRRGDLDPRIARMIDRIADLDTIVTGNEVEALILEANLIKRHRPPFNIELKDDKRFPFLKVTVGHRFPGLFLTRRLIADGSRYFGPYTHVKNLRHTLKTLRKVFPLRNCTDRRLERDERECLEFFIDRCPAPCTQRIGEEEYGRIVARLLRFLEGGVEEVVRELTEQMEEHARRLRYEEAARRRDDIETLRRLVLQQRMTPAVAADTDVVELVARGDRACCVALHVREGKVLGKEHRVLERIEGSRPEQILRTFLIGAYAVVPQLPDQIVTSVPPDEREILEAWLRERAGRRVVLKTARGGVLGRLLGAARENAHLRLEEEELRDRRRRARVETSVYDLQERLDLARTPYRIEGYDISNLHADAAVASRVCFQDGIPLKSQYRRFRMKQAQGPDDVAMIGEVLARRLQRLKTGEETAPDLILIDGGKGQVGRAAQILHEEGFGEIQLLGLAKREELVVIPGVRDPVRLPRHAEGLRLLQRVRDEAHRFAIGYHRKIRQRTQTASVLDRLPRIGPARRRALLRHFGSLAAIREADIETLCAVPGIGPTTAREILEALRAEAR
ncbi:MAG: excinuclease ABC subunit UvrC [Candidatus Eisenbacteria bacterium]|nr:excinuclease ABC subunit UvrC [Candidatus Latescibacterota bacterium]MBD3301242.1 excinuclease ABC subunit UvrC [Candidatus Eisenbacteria bacterium]